MLVAVFFFGSIHPGGAGAATNAPGSGPGKLSGKVVVLVVDRVGADDLPSAATPFCSRLAERWSIGLMVTRSGGRQESGGEYVSLGAGARLAGAQGSELCFNAGEKFLGYTGLTAAGRFYGGRTGHEPLAGGVACLGWQDIKRENQSSGNQENVGLLGSLLQASEHRVAVAGNADTNRSPSRLAPLICSDGNGIVPLGNVGPGLLERAPGEIGGYRTNVHRLVDEAGRLLAGADLLVVDSGDTGRIDREAAVVGDAHLEVEKRKALERVDLLASGIYSLLDPESCLFLIVSPGAPAQARKEGNYLTPCIAAGRGFAKGMLSSKSTRRPGIINNSDLLPTVLDFFGIAVPARVIGSAIKTGKSDASAAYLKRLYAQLEVTRRARWPIGIIYVALVIILMLLTAFCALARAGRSRLPRDPERLARVTGALAAVLLAAPLSFLVVSAFFYRGYLFPAVFCLLFSLLLGLGAWFLLKGRRPDPVVFLCLLTAAVLVIDLFAGSRLTMFPMFGVSSLEGMRYFGLPNTVVGILVAVAAWGAAGLVAPRQPVRVTTGKEEGPVPPGALLDNSVRLTLVLVVLFVLAFIIGFGALGANLGGFITAAVTFLLFGLSLTGRLGRWWIIGTCLATAAGTSLVVLLDSLFFHSHAGKTVGGGVARLLPMVERKVAIGLGQIKYLLFPALALMVAVVVVALWMRRPGSFWTVYWERRRPVMAALYSVMVGGVVGLVLNDTGIAMLGAMMVITVIVLSYRVATGGLAIPAG